MPPPHRNAGRLSVALALVAAAPSASCALRSYDSYRIEFDSAAGYDAVVGGEPAELVLNSQVMRWQYMIRNLFQGWGVDWLLQAAFGARPRVEDVEVPNAILRDAMAAMTDRAVGDLGRSADAGLRALWLLSQPAAPPIDRLRALWSVTRLAEGLGVDPLVARQVPADPGAAAEREARAVSELAAMEPARRGGPLDAAARDRWVAAVVALAAHPSPRRIEGRDAIRALLRAARFAPDPAAAEIARHALADRLGDEFSRALREELRDSPDPSVRRVALRALLRTGGPEAMPYALAVTQDPDPRRSDRYDPSLEVRRLWVRVAGAMPAALAFARYGGGPRPIDFLFDMTQQDAYPDLARIARDAMARLVGAPAVDDPDWPQRWWSEFVRAGASEAR